jgi:hypothetical protein
MIKREAPADVIQGYVKAVYDSVIEPLIKNQSRLSLHNELRTSKRFQETEVKIKDYVSAYDQLKENFALREAVVETVRKIHAERLASRMTQFMDKSQNSPVEESDAVKAVLEPYMEILKPSEDIRRLQATLMNQGKIKNMTLPFTAGRRHSIRLPNGRDCVRSNAYGRCAPLEK